MSRNFVVHAWKVRTGCTDAEDQMYDVFREFSVTTLENASMHPATKTKTETKEY